jgi:hypothetical protein
MYDRRSPARYSYAWLIVWLLGGMVAAFEDALVDAVGQVWTVATYLGIGVLLGVLWYALYPRPFGERVRAVGKVLFAYLAIAVMFLLIVGVVVMLGGNDGGTFEAHWPAPNNASFLGVPLGLVLGQRWAAARAEETVPVTR